MASGKGPTTLIATFAIVVTCTAMMPCGSDAAEGNGLWSVYDQALKGEKYVDLTHTITPNIPVWAGFAESTFPPAKAGADIEGFATKGEVYTYAKHGFEATDMRSRQTSSARSSTRRRIGHPNNRPSMSCLQLTPSGRSWSFPSSSS
jgi:hypothetical protein